MVSMAAEEPKASRAKADRKRKGERATLLQLLSFGDRGAIRDVVAQRPHSSCAERIVYCLRPKLASFLPSFIPGLKGRVIMATLRGFS